MLYFGVRDTKCSCHPPREGVDWNLLAFSLMSMRFRHPPREGVDWNKFAGAHELLGASHPLHEGVDWNKFLAYGFHAFIASPSTRGCGLKCFAAALLRRKPIVTLYTRVWIEISPPVFMRFPRFCHPLHEGVDWNPFLGPCFDFRIRSPSTRGCGLKLCRRHWRKACLRSPSTRGCGLKSYTSSPIRLAAYSIRHPLHEGVDWNRIPSTTSRITFMSPSTRGCGLK